MGVLYVLDYYQVIIFCILPMDRQVIAAWKGRAVLKRPSARTTHSRHFKDQVSTDDARQNPIVEFDYFDA